MGFSNNFALAVKVNGQFAQEKANGELHLPFGATYSLRFKNKHPRYAKVDVRIDGESIGAYEIPPHGSIDIHRPADRDTAFRFASLDSEAAYMEGKGGDNPNNVKGLIEATFYLEVQNVYLPRTVPKSFGGIRGMSSSSSEWEGSSRSIYSDSLGDPVIMNCFPDTPVQGGCTVDGGMTGQQFGVSYRNFEAQGTTIKVFLRGFVAGSVPVYPPVSALPMTDVQRENERLRQEIEEIKRRKWNELAASQSERENQRLREELEALST